MESALFVSKSFGFGRFLTIFMNCFQMILQILLKHIEIVHNKIQAYLCVSCGRKFGRKGALNVHVKTVHENVNGYRCDSCGKIFGQMSNLKRHTRTVHENMKPFICEYCNKNFGLKRVMELHVRNVHDNSLLKHLDVTYVTKVLGINMCWKNI